MTTNEQYLDIDPATIILGLGYASLLLTVVGWVATI